MGALTDKECLKIANKLLGCGCGCGRPDLALDLFVEYVGGQGKGYLDPSRPSGYEVLNSMFPEWGTDERLNGLVHFFLYVLDKHGLIEHGGSITGSWATPEGYALHNWLKAHGTNPDEWPEEEYQDG